MAFTIDNPNTPAIVQKYLKQHKLTKTSLGAKDIIVNAAGMAVSAARFRMGQKAYKMNKDRMRAPIKAGEQLRKSSSSKKSKKTKKSKKSKKSKSQ